METPTQPITALPAEGVRRYVQDRLERDAVAFTAALQRLSSISTLPEPLLIIDEQSEDGLLEAAYLVERTRKQLRFWRHARGPEGSDPYTFLQNAREHAVEMAMAPDDPTNRLGQEMERSVARSFYNQTSYDYMEWWLREDVLAQASA